MPLRLVVAAFVMLASAAPAGAKPRPHTAHVKFLAKPADATIQIAGMDPHVGSPFVVDLDPGTYQVEVRHDGFRTYVTTIDAADGDSQTIRVVLDRKPR